MVEFILNGEKVVAKKAKLLDFLREDMNITSVKNGCSEGACGTCMVIIDGKATKACVFKTDKLVGKNITTIEDYQREKEMFLHILLLVKELYNVDFVFQVW